VFGLQNRVLPVGSQFLEVVAPVREGTAGGRYLDQRGGDGGYMVITQTDDHAAVKGRIAELGVRKVAEHDEPEHHILQLHPRDTGGSFLEIDWHADLRPDGEWPPAGDDWRKAVCTDVVEGITAAEIQAADPDRIAARWSDVLQLPLEQEQATPLLRLENATIRFVPARDGRGEGLGGVDLASADPERARSAAKERGLLAADGTVVICGTRFRLA
jgi:hypothetical protein